MFNPRLGQIITYVFIETNAIHFWPFLNVALCTIDLHVCFSAVLWFIREWDPTRHGGGHLPAQLPVLPGTDLGFRGDGPVDIAGGWGPGRDVLFESDVVCGLPVFLTVCGVPRATARG